MKKALVIVLSVLASLSAFAQGTVNISNKDNNKGINAPIFDVSLTGAKLDGTAYFAQLFGGAAGTAESALVACGDPVNFRTGTAAGYLPSTLVAIPGVDYGGNSATVQLRAWSANGGNTWAAASAAALANGDVHTGVSKLLTIKTAASAIDVAGIPGLVGLESFAITSQTVIPEPSTIAMFLLGGAALLIRRRK